MLDASQIAFQPFDRNGEVLIYNHGILPHWRQAGGTYFVTFRLADSLPAEAWMKLEEERLDWLRRRGIDGKSSDWRNALAQLPERDQRNYEREVAVRLNGQLDCGWGTCVLRDSTVAQIVGDALVHFHGQRVCCGDYVVMPNHVHVLLTPIAPYELEDLLKSIKGFTGLKINQHLGRSGTLWQRESFDHIVRDWAQLARFQHYIAANPKKAYLPESEYLHQVAEYRPCDHYDGYAPPSADSRSGDL